MASPANAPTTSGPVDGYSPVTVHHRALPADASSVSITPKFTYAIVYRMSLHEEKTRPATFYATHINQDYRLV
jgi:hypothetical protein